MAIAAPQFAYSAPIDDSSEELRVVPILRDERVHLEDGRFNVEVETGNGITLSRSGNPEGVDNAVVQAGQYS